MEEDKMEEDKVVRRRTVEFCFKAIKSIDKYTGITENFIRDLCKANKVDHFVTGKAKILVNYDDLLDYINNGFKRNQQQALAVSS